MDTINKMRNTIDHLEWMMDNPMSSTASDELIRTIENWGGMLNDVDARMRQSAIDELQSFQSSARNPMVASLLFGLVSILNDPQVSSNSTLIKAILTTCYRVGDQAQSPSASQGDAVDRNRDPGDDANTEVPGPEVRFKPSPIKDPLSRVRLEIDSSFDEDSEATPTSPRPQRLNIWSDEVRWDNDDQFFRIYLPRVKPTEKSNALADLVCSLVHLELGHRLIVKYPGVEFSVLINHSTINGVVEARDTRMLYVIRMAKTRPIAWPYVTFVDNITASHVTFFLDAKEKRDVPKTIALLKLLHKKKLDISTATGLPDVHYLEHIPKEEGFDPYKILKYVRRCNFHQEMVTSFYKIVCRCICDSCSHGFERVFTPVPKPVASSNFKRKQIQPKQLHSCDVWWDNDVDFARIYLPLDGQKLEINDDYVKIAVSANSPARILQVLYGRTTFTAMLHFEQDPPIDVKIEGDSLVVRIHKTNRVMWPFLTYFTIDEGYIVTYHLNPYYHLKAKNDVPAEMDDEFSKSVEAYTTNLINAHHFKYKSDIGVIFQDAQVLHQTIPVDDSGYKAIRRWRSII